MGPGDAADLDAVVVIDFDVAGGVDDVDGLAVHSGSEVQGVAGPGDVAVPRDVAVGQDRVGRSGWQGAGLSAVQQLQGDWVVGRTVVVDAVPGHERGDAQAEVRLTQNSGQVVVLSGGLGGRLVGLSGQLVFVL